MTGDEMRAHAREWTEAWNRRDVEAVLRPIRDDATFVSPKAAAFAGSARLSGKAAIATNPSYEGRCWRRRAQ